MRVSTALRRKSHTDDDPRLLVATQYDPYSILEKLFPYLGGSASIVVHSPYVQVVSIANVEVKVSHEYSCRLSQTSKIIYGIDRDTSDRRCRKGSCAATRYCLDVRIR